jgi:hypothetical protein
MAVNAPKVLAFLQNMWFQDPEGAKRIFDRHPEKRNYLIAQFLFMGCLTGRRLKAAFGEELCDQIVWEECSREVGGHSRAKFKADLEHIGGALVGHRPDIVLAFGSIAANAVFLALNGLTGTAFRTELICGPHPAARAGAVAGLAEMAKGLRAILDRE